jgi:hypothetical protein
LRFAQDYRWWGILDYVVDRDDSKRKGDWRKVVWSDKTIFETRKNSRVWVIKRVDERRCFNCIRFVYRSGRTTVMIWGVIGWGYKSLLVFIEKLLRRKGVCSKAYLQQVLEFVIFPLFETLGENYMYMEDGSKVHKGNARLPKLQHGIREFNWLPSFPNLNPIEKV